MSVILGNRYEVTKLIGKGGMADVYLALDTILKREVAIKVLKADLSSDPVALERFNREAIATTQLSHPNIVDVYDVGEDSNHHYIVMEYIKGYTLKDLIRKRGTIPYKESVWMIKQLAGALMEAHRKGIIHRDVKSQNVLIKPDGTIKITDFGIAIASGSMQITSKDSVLGSVHYLAPELSKGGHASMQSDIYSLGIVLYEMLTGDVPYKGDTPVQVALQHIKSEMKPVRDIDPTIPQSVENIVIQATAKNPDNRYKNVALMIQDLNECLSIEHLNDAKIDLDKSLEKKAVENMHISKDIEKKAKKKDGESIFLTIFLICVSVLSAFILGAVLFLTGVIGSNKSQIVVPQIVSLTVQEASDLLNDYGLDLDTANIEWVLTDNAVKGKIISCVPTEGSEVEVGTKIKVTASKGLYEVLGNYVGKQYLEAGKYLEALGFSVKYESVESDKESGIVVEQSIKEGEKYDPSVRSSITLKYSAFTNFKIDSSLKGTDLAEFLTYLNDSNIKYELSKQNKDFFTDVELQDCKEGTVVLTNPYFDEEFVVDENTKVLVYYYE